MNIYTVEGLHKFDYDLSVSLTKHGCYTDKAKALQQAHNVYESMCAEYEDEMRRHADPECFEDEASGALHVEEDKENGYYCIAFGANDDYECHSVAVETWELEE